MPEILMTDENRPLLDALMRLVALGRNESAEDMLVEAILELVEWRKIGRQVSAIREHGRGDPHQPYDAQISLATITKARQLLAGKVEPT